MIRTLCLILAVAVALPATAAVDLFQTADGSSFSVGHAVSDAGDVNNDGFPDFVVGAPYDDTGGADRGRAFIWFGGPDMTDVPNVILTGDTGGDWFGFSVAGVGDVDNDGFDDVAVGAPGDDRNGDRSGSVFLYTGRSADRRTTGLSWSAARIYSGEVGGDRFGWSVSRAGDMDLDGIDDFVVGAPYADATGTDRGRVYLFTGGSSVPSSTPAVFWDGPALGGPISSGDFVDFAPDGIAIAGPGFGWSLADVENFTGDGAAVAVGAPGAAGATGRVSVFVADDPLPSTATSVFVNDVANEQFGWSVSSAGDVGGTALPDLLVGGPGEASGTGFVKIYFGDSTPSATVNTADRERGGQTSGDRFGFAVADVGDHLGGSGSWVAGAPKRDDGGLDAGWVYLFDALSTSPTDVRAVNRTGSSEPGDHFGFALSGLGDLDGDGRDDFLVGAPEANVQDGSARGLVALISSQAGVVSAPVPRLDVRHASSTRVALAFTGAGLATATTVEVTADGRRLAALGAGIERTFDGVVAEFARPQASDDVLLRWTADGTTREQVISLPAATTASVRLRATTASGATELRFGVDRDAPWTLRVFDVRGRAVARPARGDAAVIERTLRFDGADDTGRPLAAGVYFAVLSQEGRRATARVLLTR